MSRPRKATAPASAPADATQLAEAIGTIVRDVVINELRAGGLLAKLMQSTAARITPAPASEAPGSLEWSPTLLEGRRVTFAEAEKACAVLGDGWRLPSLAELESIRDITRWNPSIDTERFPDTQSTWYWTGTPHASSPAGCAWVVSFNVGSANYCHRDYYDACVRAVRSVVPGQ